MCPRTFAFPGPITRATCDRPRFRTSGTIKSGARNFSSPNGRMDGYPTFQRRGKREENEGRNWLSYSWRRTDRLLRNNRDIEEMSRKDLKKKLTSSQTHREKNEPPTAGLPITAPNFLFSLVRKALHRFVIKDAKVAGPGCFLNSF